MHLLKGIKLQEVCKRCKLSLQWQKFQKTGYETGCLHAVTLFAQDRQQAAIAYRLQLKTLKITCTALCTNCVGLVF